jgi:hypothetical protein
VEVWTANDGLAADGSGTSGTELQELARQRCFEYLITPLANALLGGAPGRKPDLHLHEQGTPGTELENYQFEMLTYGLRRVFAVKYGSDPLYLETWSGAGFTGDISNNLALRGLELRHTQEHIQRMLNGRELLIGYVEHCGGSAGRPRHRATGVDGGQVSRPPGRRWRLT